MEVRCGIPVFAYGPVERVLLAGVKREMVTAQRHPPVL